MKESEDRIYIKYVALSKLQRVPRNPKAHDLGLLDRSREAVRSHTFAIAGRDSSPKLRQSAVTEKTDH
jgi:hypothetical protein